MKKLYINESMISEHFWATLRFSKSALPECMERTCSIVEASRVIHRKFPQEIAGTISVDSVSMLWLIARYFRPRIIAEVGTFIGRSTLALAEGAGEGLKLLHTCDFSFSDFEIPPDVKSSFANAKKIQYFPKTASSEMFRKMVPMFREKVDCFFLDGRLQSEDLGLIKELMSSDAIFILDDFEGVEKGVVNGVLLRQALPDLITIRPELRCNDGQRPFSLNLALMLPIHCLQNTRQQCLPLDMS